MVEWTFIVVLHRKGKFKYGPSLHYDDREVITYHSQDIDEWCFFDVVGLLKGDVFDGSMKLWWKAEHASFEGNLEPFLDNNDAMELTTYAIQNKCEMAIYVEHPVTTLDYTHEMCFEDGQR